MRAIFLGVLFLLGTHAYASDTAPLKMTKKYTILEGFSLPKYFASSLTEHPEQLNKIGTITVVFLADNFTNNDAEGFPITGHIESMDLIEESELKIASRMNWLTYQNIFRGMRNNILNDDLSATLSGHMNVRRNKFWLKIYKDCGMHAKEFEISRGNEQRTSLSYTDEYDNTNEFELIEIK